MSRIPDDPSFEASSATLGELSQEVSRIASALANLAAKGGDAATGPVELPANDSFNFDPPIETVQKLIHAKRLRARFFDEKLLADPAWNMLLELFYAEISQRPVSVEALCLGSAVPATTALRWVRIMTEADLIRSYPHLHDDGRIFIELSTTARTAMRGYFSELGRLHSPSSSTGNVAK